MSIRDGLSVFRISRRDQHDSRFLAAPEKRTREEVDLGYACEQIEQVGMKAGRYECRKTSDGSKALTQALCELTCKDDSKTWETNHSKMVESLFEMNIASKLIDGETNVTGFQFVENENENSEIIVVLLEVLYGKLEYKLELKFRLISCTPFRRTRSPNWYVKSKYTCSCGGLEFDIQVRFVYTDPKEISVDRIRSCIKSFFYEQHYGAMKETMPAAAYLQIPAAIHYLIAKRIENDNNVIELEDSHRIQRVLKTRSGDEYSITIYSAPFLFVHKGRTYYEGKGFVTKVTSESWVNLEQREQIRLKIRNSPLMPDIDPKYTIGYMVDAFLMPDLPMDIQKFANEKFKGSLQRLVDFITDVIADLMMQEFGVEDYDDFLELTSNEPPRLAFSSVTVSLNE